MALFPINPLVGDVFITPTGTPLIYTNEGGWAVDVSSVGAEYFPVGALRYGTTAGRPASPVFSQMYYNTDLAYIEFWNGAAWIQVGGSTPGELDYGLIANRPTAPNPGQLFFRTDINEVEVYDGAVWNKVDEGFLGQIPIGNTASRPVGTNLAIGRTYFNTDTLLFEIYDGASWRNISVNTSDFALKSAQNTFLEKNIFSYTIPQSDETSAAIEVSSIGSLANVVALTGNATQSGVKASVTSFASSTASTTNKQNVNTIEAVSRTQGPFEFFKTQGVYAISNIAHQNNIDEAIGIYGGAIFDGTATGSARKGSGVHGVIQIDSATTHNNVAAIRADMFLNSSATTITNNITAVRATLHNSGGAIINDAIGIAIDYQNSADWNGIECVGMQQDGVDINKFTGKFLNEIDSYGKGSDFIGLSSIIDINDIGTISLDELIVGEKKYMTTVAPINANATAGTRYTQIGLLNHLDSRSNGHTYEQIASKNEIEIKENTSINRSVVQENTTFIGPIYTGSLIDEIITNENSVILTGPAGVQLPDVIANSSIVSFQSQVSTQGGKSIFANKSLIEDNIATSINAAGDMYLHYMEYDNSLGSFTGHTGTRYGICQVGNVELNEFRGDSNFVGNITATGTITTPSDIRIKENIVPLENALDLVLKLDSKIYVLKEGKKREIGLIAQEVEKVVPEVVAKNRSTGLLGIDYAKLVTLPIGAIKELNDEVNSLKNEVKELKELVNKLLQDK